MEIQNLTTAMSIFRLNNLVMMIIISIVIMILMPMIMIMVILMIMIMVILMIMIMVILIIMIMVILMVIITVKLRYTAFSCQDYILLTTSLIKSGEKMQNITTKGS